MNENTSDVLLGSLFGERWEDRGLPASRTADGVTVFRIAWENRGIR